MSDTTTRTVHMRLDPALVAYLTWLDQEGRQFTLHDYELFSSGYRWDRPAEPVADEQHVFGTDDLW
jgi:hypothetical protein